MTTHRWKRCQECGAEAIPCDDIWYHEGDEPKVAGIHCTECQSGDPVRFWDMLQSTARARKRFELVTAMTSGLIRVEDGTGVSVDGILQVAGVLLAELYGPVPVPEVGSE